MQSKLLVCSIDCPCSHWLFRFSVLHSNKTVYTIKYIKKIVLSPKGALTRYGKLTWESAHVWNLILLCLLIVWGMNFIFMVHLSFYAIPLLIYDVMYDITTIP